MQPTIYPLFKTRQWQDSLLKWTGVTTNYIDLIKTYWIGKLGSEMAWDKALQDGVINPTNSVAVNTVTLPTNNSISDSTTHPVTASTGRGGTFNNATVATAI